MKILARIASWLWPIWALGLALILGAILIRLNGTSPWEAYKAMALGAFGDRFGWSTTLTKMAPILLTALAVVLPWRAGLLNVGGEGQLYLGGLCATLVGFMTLPWPFHLPACLAAGFLGGCVWALIPGLLRAYRQSNEVILTLLLNYVAINLISALAGGWLMEADAPYPYTPEIETSAHLPKLWWSGSPHQGFLLGTTIGLSLWIYFSLTGSGLKLKMVGQNPKAAHYAGISVKSRLWQSLAVGGGLAGLAGAVEVLGAKHRLYHLFGSGYGYDGIVAAFLGFCHPGAAIVSSLFLGGLRTGASQMQRSAGVPESAAAVIQGFMLIMVAIGAALRTRANGRSQETEAKEAHGL